MATTKEKELIMISAIIVDNYIKSVYKERNSGYFDTLDIVVETTEAFYEAFKTHIESNSTEWSEICEAYDEKCFCYDDLVILWTGKHLREKHNLLVKIEE